MNQYSVGERVHRPDIWCPISMAQPSGKGEEPAQQLFHLSPIDKGAERARKYSDDREAKLDAVAESDCEPGRLAEAVGS